MPKSDKNKGDETEEFIERIAGTMFLRNFVIRNPKFKKKSGQEKEVTDVLIPFGESLISIQAKSKVIDTESTTDDVIQARIQKIIENAVGQIANTSKIVAAGEPATFKNVHGIEIPINSAIVKGIQGLVIVKIYDQNGNHVPVDSDYAENGDVPVHIIDALDFYAISSEIDTIPDFIDYLTKRAKLFRKDQIFGDFHELDLLALYKTRPELFEKAWSDDKTKIVLMQGIWDEYQSSKRDDIKRRNRLNRNSYLVDSTIEQLSGAIDFAPGTVDPSTGKKMEVGTIHDYWVTIYELSRMRRLERRVFGDKMVEKMQKADLKDGADGYFLSLPHDGEGVLFYSLNADDRQQRIDRLYRLASIAYVNKELTQIIAIATEPLVGHGRSIDVIVLKNVKFKNADEIRKIRAFSDGKHSEGFEYQGSDD